ncbi:MAG: 5-(carboxyamino)imidazole ribonucleotide synthase [Gammaproteobacteria bacterium]
MRVGIVGGGQLGRMLAFAARPLGLEVTVLDASEDAPAAAFAPMIVGDFGDRGALGRLADASDVVTFDFENVPADAADWLEERVCVRPGPRALRVAQDRIAEKSLFTALDIPVAPYAAVDDTRSLTDALAVTGLPAVLKTRRLGYDGKGQCVVRSAEDAERARITLGGTDLILEGFVQFDREVSLVAARAIDGTVAAYPMVENLHRDGILHTTHAPAKPGRFDADASSFVAHLLDELDYVGVIALELFECADGLRANEFAPRVHNSGHWTIEGAVTSQFENHLRAITGMPLGETTALGPSAMVNFIGGMPDAAAIAAIPGAHLHDYGKTARPGRKLGHATVTAMTRDELATRVHALSKIADAASR